MTKEEIRNIKIEIKSRKIIAKKLESAIKSIKKITDKQKAEREERKQNLTEYKSESELQDAYGWGAIEEDEYYKLLHAMRDGTEAIDNEMSAEEIALEILAGWKKIMNSDIDDLQFQLLPQAEQDRIRDMRYEAVINRNKRHK